MSRSPALAIGTHYEYPFGGMAPRPEWRPAGPDDYRRDIAMIKDTGFDSIRIRIGLDSDLDDVGALLDICQEAGLSALYGFATFYVHNDFIAAFPDCKSIDRHGQAYPLHPHDYRWQRCCINHPEYRRQRNQLLADSARRFHDHPAVRDWDVHNEPHLGPGEYPCYNPHTLAVFRAHCRARFADIMEFNQRFGLACPDFDAAEPPDQPDASATGYWRFWREFMSKNLSDFLLEGVRIIEENAPGARASFNFTYPRSPHRTGQDWWVTPRLGYASTSLYRGSDERTASSAGASLSLLKALARDKETWVTEFQGGPFREDVLWRGIHLEAEINQVFSHAIDALYIYRWDPLMAGAEPWINGMVDVDNYDTEKRLRTQQVIAGLRPHQDIIASGRNVTPRIGIFTTRECLWQASLKDIPLNDITTGLYALFLDMGYEVTFLTDDLDPETDLEVICLPYLPGVSEAEWQAAQAFMRKGGRVIAELPMQNLAATQAVGDRLQIDCQEHIQPIYFIAGWSLNHVNGQFGGFAFHDRLFLNRYQGEVFATYRDNGKPALIQSGPQGRLLIPTFPLGRSYVSSFHHSLRALLQSWLPDDLEPDIAMEGVPEEYRPLTEARLVESAEGNLLFVINRSGYAWTVKVTPRGYETVDLQLPTHGAERRLVSS